MIRIDHLSDELFTNLIDLVVNDCKVMRKEALRILYLNIYDANKTS